LTPQRHHEKQLLELAGHHDIMRSWLEGADDQPALVIAGSDEGKRSLLIT
jgi:hypothetical protein